MKKHSLCLALGGLLFLGYLGCHRSAPKAVPPSVWYQCVWTGSKGEQLFTSGQYFPPSSPDTENCIIEDDSGKITGKFPCGPKTTTSTESSTNYFDNGESRNYFIRQSWDQKDPNALRFDLGYKKTPTTAEVILSTQVIDPIPKIFVREFKNNQQVVSKVSCEARPDLNLPSK